MTKSAKTREYIIEKSALLFNTKGLAATAMSDVMEVTDMAKGGIYGHFESKQELASAVVDYNLKNLVNKVEVEVGKAVSARQKLFTFLDVFKNPLRFPVDGGCPLINFGAEADDTNPEVKEKVKSVIEASQKKITQIIQQGIKQGEFRNTFNAREFSIKMFSLIEGGTLIGRTLHTNSQMIVIIRMLKKDIESELI